MSRDSYSDLLAFIQVAQHGSFTRAAAKMGVSPSALSHAVGALETRLDVRLLTRTTRSVSTTDAGDRLLASVAPHFEEIDAELTAVSELRKKPSGTVRITAGGFAAGYVIWPKLEKVLPNYPDISVEIAVEYQRTDIETEKYDAGVRLGDEVAKDMVAVRISADQRIAVVGSPSYFDKRPVPKKPADLADHNCINLRLPTSDSLMPWDFRKGKQAIKVRVTGQWIYNGTGPILRAALAGQGLAFIPEDMAMEHLAKGELIRVLVDWCQPYPGYHLYYPKRRQTSRALDVVVDALRHEEVRPRTRSRTKS